MTLLRENSLKKIEISQLRQSLASIIENGEILEQNFKKSEMEIALKEEKVKSELNSLEINIGNKLALIYAQIENIENVIKHLATTNRGTKISSSDSSVTSTNNESLRQRIEIIGQSYRDEIDDVKGQLTKLKNTIDSNKDNLFQLGNTLPQVKAEIGHLEHKVDLKIRNATDVDTR